MLSSRRGFLGGAGLAGLGAASPALGASSTPDAAWLQARLERYNGFGIKASGGSGDTACGAWLEQGLASWGYACRRQRFEVPYFDIRQATLSCSDARAAVIPQAIVAPTGPRGLTAPLRLASDRGDLSGAIAILVLPYKRWAGLAEPEVARPLGEAIARGAAAVVLVTTGATGEAIALNVSTHRPAYEQPVAILAPKEAGPFLRAAEDGHTGTLIVDGKGGQRPAFNVIARLERNAPRTLVISTPRSGWFGCAAERGSGLVVWLWLARRLSQASHEMNIELAAASGHEYAYLGAEHFPRRPRHRRPRSGSISARAPPHGTGTSSAPSCGRCPAPTLSGF